MMIEYFEGLEYKIITCNMSKEWSHGKSTILLVFTRKDGDFHGRAVSFREGNFKDL